MGIEKLQSPDVERKLLGCLILDEEQRLNLELKLSADLFSWPAHRKVYSIIYEIENKTDLEVDLTTVVEEARKKHDEDTVSPSYITNCVNQVASPIKAENYFKQLYDLYYRRQIIKASGQNKKLALNFENDIDEIVAKAEESLFSLTTEAERKKGYRKLSDNLSSHIDGMITSNDSGMVGVPTPFTKLNEWTRGLKPGETTIIAARPKMGKSTFTSNIAQHAAVKENIPVGFYSLEMTEKKLVRRMIANEVNINSHKLRNGTLNDQEANRVISTADNLYEAPIFINDNAGLSIQQIRSDARRMKKNENIELVVIDYVEIVGYEGYTERKSERLFEIIREISEMNKELDVHTILLSQVSRKCENRNDKRPMLSDIKASGGLEQEAQMIGFLYRDSYYNSQVPQELKNVTEFIVAADRDGEPKRCLLELNGKYNRFENCPPWKAQQYNQWLKE